MADIQMISRDVIQSARSTEKAYVRFVNCTQKTVEVIWINFSGGYVSYQILERGRFVDINTFKRHPWIAIDHENKDRLHIEKNFVFYPKTTREFFRDRTPRSVLPPEFEARVRAAITLPVYTLRYLSLLKLRNSLRSPEDADELELPKELVNDLKKVITQRNNQELQPLIRI